MNRKSPKRLKALIAIPVAFLMLVAVTSCGDETDAATSTASCAFVLGDGQSGRDAKLHKVLYPGEQVDLEEDGSGNDTEVVQYFPCNSRNFIINDGTVKNANGEQVGDRFTPVIGYTTTGVPIEMAVTAYWTPNQAQAAMPKFFDLCFKYQCASSADIGGGENYSTAGWNGMLGENFGPSIDIVGLKASATVSDDVWKKHDPALYEQLSNTMSAEFADAVRATTGYTQDIFCGSGNSGWKNPDAPGEGEFTCTPVRFRVTAVNRAKVEDSEGTQGAEEINKQLLAAAIAKYGEDGAFWLALQDTIAKCKNAGTACVFNFGGSNIPVVPETTNTEDPAAG